MSFNQNNLANSSSPYLQQHKDNPVHWQEWSQESLDHAQNTNKPLFVSIGYATCHWCHVMAQEVFSNSDIATYLNQHFICIKVDKEQRPEIDAYAMAFLQETTGHSGWPLNIFLTPQCKPPQPNTFQPYTPQPQQSQLKPFCAFTYLPPSAFHETIRGIVEFYNHKQEKIKTYIPHAHHQPSTSQLPIQSFIDQFNPQTSSFASGPQFPPHCTLLFLLHYYEQTRHQELRTILLAILNKIATGGLHDHLQGGFFRYCIDESWTTPHFEKMLYDQAMLLWIYSLAFKIFAKEEYKTITQNILHCLEQTFTQGDLYYSGLDADTNHEEGKTYFWTPEEIATLLTPSQLIQFQQLYDLVDGHLIKKKFQFQPEIEAKLLNSRQRRPQPATDTKTLTSWNALLGIAFISCYRYTNNTLAKTKAHLVFNKLKTKHYTSTQLYHSSNHGQHQHGSFLEDYASFLLFTTYLAEEDETHIPLIKELVQKVQQFYDPKTKQWQEHHNTDFPSLHAQTYDHPLPSSSSLVHFALARADYFTNISNTTPTPPLPPIQYKSLLAHDFWNLATFFTQGNCHIIFAPHPIAWHQLPAFSLQVPSKQVQYCYHKECKQFPNVSELLGEVKKNQINSRKDS